MRAMTAIIIIVLLVVVGYFVLRDKTLQPADVADQKSPEESPIVVEPDPAPILAPECQLIGIKIRSAGHPRAVWAIVEFEFDREVLKFEFSYRDANKTSYSILEHPPAPLEFRCNTPRRKWVGCFENFGYIQYSLSGTFVVDGAEYQFSTGEASISWDGEKLGYEYNLNTDVASHSPLKIALFPNYNPTINKELLRVDVVYYANYYYRSSLGKSDTPDDAVVLDSLSSDVVIENDGWGVKRYLLLDREQLIEVAGDKIDRIEGYLIITATFRDLDKSENFVCAGMQRINLPGKASSLQ
jgi:hypothetical protein